MFIWIPKEDLRSPNMWETSHITSMQGFIFSPFLNLMAFIWKLVQKPPGMCCLYCFPSLRYATKHTLVKPVATRFKAPHPERTRKPEQKRTVLFELFFFLHVCCDAEELNGRNLHSSVGKQLKKEKRLTDVSLWPQVGMVHPPKSQICRLKVILLEVKESSCVEAQQGAVCGLVFFFILDVF